MSKYEDYNAVSRNYDNQRFAMGVNETCAMLQFFTGKPLKELSILDAGCGTGNFTKDMIGYGAGHMTLLDGSDGMLEKARTKLAEHIENDKVRDVVHATMPPLPFPDKSFDVVMFNFVLHHLEQNPDGKNYPTIEETLKETRRVMKPDGILSISTSLFEYVSRRMWFHRFNEEIGRRNAKHYPDIQQWEGLLERAGFQVISVTSVLWKMPPNLFESFTDPLGPTKKEWRDCNSYWASATPDELAEIEKEIGRLKVEGKLVQFVKDNDKSGGFIDIAFIQSCALLN